MKKLILLSGILVFLLLYACSPFTLVNSSVIGGADLSKYHTFSFVNFPKEDIPDAFKAKADAVKEAIKNQMLARGYTYQEKEGELEINAFLKLQRQAELVGNTTPSGAYGFWGGYNTTASLEIYDEGTFMLNLTDSKTKALVWQSVVSEVIDKNTGGIVDENKINQFADVLFSQYPVKKIQKK